MLATERLTRTTWVIPGASTRSNPVHNASHRLRETIGYHDILNVHFQSVALGDVSVDQPIYVSRRPNDHRRSMLPFADSVPVKVAVRRLDDVLGEQGVSKVDLL
jgi:hypothetical protein